MSEYKIHRWDVVMSGSSNQQAPMIYVKPDLTFLQFIRDNNYAVMCQVAGTGTIYDGKMIPGVVSASADVPSCRPNFFKETGLYVVKLWSNWYGYPRPDQLGGVKFLGKHGKSDSNEDQKHHTKEPDKHTEEKKEHSDIYRHLAPEVSKDRNVRASSSVTSSPPKPQGLGIMTIIAIIFGGIFLILLSIVLWDIYKSKKNENEHQQPVRQIDVETPETRASEKTAVRAAADAARERRVFRPGNVRGA